MDGYDVVIIGTGAGGGTVSFLLLIFGLFTGDLGRRAGSSLQCLVDGIIFFTRRIRADNLEIAVLVAK